MYSAQNAALQKHTDQSSSKISVSFFGNINLQGNDINDVGAIRGMFGKWSIDENGKLIAKEIEVGKLKAKNDVEFGTPGNPIGITIYDKQTNEPSCVSISGGALVVASGFCNALPPPPPPEIPPPPENEEVSSTPPPEPDTGTTTPESSDTGTTTPQ